MKNSPTKQTLKFQAMPMQEMRILLEEDLLKSGYSSFLTNMTDNDLSLKVMKNSQKPTIVSLTRHRHRPLEIELIVDHALLKSHDLVTKRDKAKNTSSRSSFMMYRWLWIGLILFSIIISTLLFIVDVIVELIEQITPGWSNAQRGYGIIGIALLIVLWFVYGRPRVQSYDRKKRSEMDGYLLDKIKNFISSITQQAPDKSIIRCWNCFKEIERIEKFCPNCGEQQN